MRTLIRTTLLSISCLLSVTACRHDEIVSFVTEQTTGGNTSATDIVGLYVLCEGNMGSNKCTLDYLDLGHTSTYYRNIYGDRNPNTVMELGDVGNDIAIYGSRLWMVINCSNKVEVCEAMTARRIGQVDIANARYLAFDRGFAYVSSYAGPVKVDEKAPLGRVYKVDTLTLAKVDSVVVGYQPEELAIRGKELYVANSGGYRVPKYDDRITVIDLETFAVKREIEVAINLHRLRIDSHGTLWASSRGNYFDTPSRLYWIAEDGQQGYIDRGVSNMTLTGDSLYCIGSTFNYLSGSYEKDYFMVDCATRSVVATTIFDADELQSITIPYGIVVNPIERDFYLMDARNYVSSGRLLHFLADGTFDWKVDTGDIPSCGCFVSKSNTTND